MKIQLSKAQHDMALDGDLSEVCELHARGHLIEVIAVHVGDLDFIDGGVLNGFVVSSGKIDGALYDNDGLHNVTCIGGSLTYHDDAVYHAFTEHAEAMAFAVAQLMSLDLVDAV